MRPINVIISWSSGKDSALTLMKLLDDTSFNVVGLYTTYVGSDVPYQGTPLAVLYKQAELIGLPLVTIELPEVFPSNEIYQRTVIDGLNQSNLNIEAVAFGDMFHNGIADYRKSYIEPAGMKCVFPLLGIDSAILAEEIINSGIQTFIATAYKQYLGNDFTGHWYTKQLIERLPVGVDPCGENGEFHTLVVDAPFFSAKLELTYTNKETLGDFCYQRYRLDIP